MSCRDPNPKQRMDHMYCTLQEWNWLGSHPLSRPCFVPCGQFARKEPTIFKLKSRLVPSFHALNPRRPLKATTATTRPRTPLNSKYRCFCTPPPPNTSLVIHCTVYPSVPACCFFHQCCGEEAKARSPAATAPAFHAQACLRTWKSVCSCIARLGKMLLYGLQGQQLGEHGEVLYDREGALFDTLWELLLRFLVPYASEAARWVRDTVRSTAGTY